MSVQALLSELSVLGVKLRLMEDKQLEISASKGVLSDAMMQRLRQSKSKLIEWLSEHDDSHEAGALPVIQPDPGNLYQPFPAADLQTAFLMGDGMDMEFHVRPHYYLEDELDGIDAARYEKAFNAALYRQRANLVTATDDLHLQTLQTFTPVQVKVQDLRSLSQDEAEAALLQTRAAMSRQILPVNTWPWLDCRISLYGDGKARLHFNNNNVFSDGYGSQKLLSDTLHIYHHPDQPLPDLSLSFRDCVLALEKMEDTPLGLASKRYWTERLPHFPSAPQLPMRTGVDTRMRSMLERRQMILPPDVWSAFKDKARRYGLTPTNAIFAVYAELISCWSGSRHFLLNNMVTHRFPFHPEVKEIVGNFASLYPLEVDLRAKEPFYERARKLQERIMSDLQHVYWSGVKVIQALNQVQKTPGRAPCPFVVGSGLFMKPYEEPFVACLETPQVLLDHQFWDLSDGGIWMVWDLIEKYFPDGMIDDMWTAYRALLIGFSEDEHFWTKTEFDLLPAAQRHQRVEINNDKVALPGGMLHGSLATRAAACPDKPVVVTPSRTLTYGELYRCAAGLATRLKTAGAKRQELVAVMLDKGWEQVAAVYGILMAGAAYVPMDPEWPGERIRYLLRSVNAKLVLTRKDLLETLNLPDHVQAVCVDDSASGFDAEKSDPLGVKSDPGDLAYIIFTSGSTGTPKGVMISHQSALNTVIDINCRFGVAENDVTFGISSACFDLSVYDLFGTVAAGGTMVLPDDSTTTSPDAWIDSIRRQNVTVWNSVPALMQLLVDAAQSRDIMLPSLQTVLLSGDWIPVSLPQKIWQVAPNARVISLGGATEASIWSIYYPIDHVDSSWVSIPYGRPLANQSWHVLDENGNDAPTWVPGHLHIGGVGLAQGYWQDQTKTDAAFVRHPQTGERLYKTGDLGRYLPDRNIEFLGRSDFQVKIQGFRVELGEIEQALMSHPSIAGAAVLASATGAGRQILSFIIPKAGAAELSAEAVQEFLYGKLPRYMVPSQVIQVAQMPLSANGKVDRQALLLLSETVQKEAKVYAPPRNEVETKLAAIWEEVLALNPIGIHDDFFELGGQSFAAVRVMTRINKQFGRTLPLSVLLEGRTIAYLADSLLNAKSWSPLVPMRVDGSKDRPCFFVHPAGGNVICYRELAEKLGKPFYGLQAAGLSAEQPPLERIEQMAALYLEKIREVQPMGPYLLGGWSSGGIIAFEIARQLEQMGETVERVLMLDTPAPLQHEEVDDISLLLWFLEDLNIGFDSASFDVRALADIEPGKRLAGAFTLMARQIAVDLDVPHMEVIHTVFKGIIKACRAYRPIPILAPLSVFRAREGRVSEFADHPADGTLDWGWASLTRGKVASTVVSGSHYTILSPQNIDALLSEMKRQLK